MRKEAQRMLMEKMVSVEKEQNCLWRAFLNQPYHSTVGVLVVSPVPTPSL